MGAALAAALQIVEKVYVIVNEGRPRADTPTISHCFIGDAALGVLLGITSYQTFSINWGQSLWLSFRLCVCVCSQNTHNPT